MNGWRVAGRGGLELTQATAAVRRGRIALGARAAEGAREVLAPAGRAGAALGALVHVCSGEGSPRIPPHRMMHCEGVGAPSARDGGGPLLPGRTPSLEVTSTAITPAPSQGRLPKGPAHLLSRPRPLPYPEPCLALTAAGPAPLAAVARQTGNALEAPRFVLAFAIWAGTRVSALVDVCTVGRNRTRLGTTWPARRSASSAGPPFVTNRQGEAGPLGSGPKPLRGPELGRDGGEALRPHPRPRDR